MSEEFTNLLLSYVHGLMESLGYHEVEKDSLRGMATIKIYPIKHSVLTLKSYFSNYLIFRFIFLIYNDFGVISYFLTDIMSFFVIKKRRLKSAKILVLFFETIHFTVYIVPSLYTTTGVCRIRLSRIMGSFSQSSVVDGFESNHALYRDDKQVKNEK